MTGRSAAVLFRASTAALLVLPLALSGCSGEKSPEPTLATVTPSIESVAIDGPLVTASGSIEEITEKDGLCRFTFWASNGAASRLTATGQVQGGGVGCGPVSEAVSLLPAGQYSVILSYESSVSSGESEPVILKVP